jgi:hypothetical protein
MITRIMTVKARKTIYDDNNNYCRSRQVEQDARMWEIGKSAEVGRNWQKTILC